MLTNSLWETFSADGNGILDNLENVGNYSSISTEEFCAANAFVLFIINKRVGKHGLADGFSSGKLPPALHLLTIINIVSLTINY